MAAWSTVPSNGSYEVSDEGEARSIDRIIERNGKPTRLAGKVLKPLKHTQGYW